MCVCVRANMGGKILVPPKKRMILCVYFSFIY